MITHCNIGKKKRTFHVVLDSFVASRSPLKYFIVCGHCGETLSSFSLARNGVIFLFLEQYVIIIPLGCGRISLVNLITRVAGGMAILLSVKKGRI